VLTELRKHSLADSYQLHATGGSIAYAICWLAVLAGAAIVLVRAQHWPQRASRFERTAPQAVIPTDPDEEPDTAAIWKAIDAGQDPTVPTSTNSRETTPGPTSGPHS
jgi:hypothetical protein